MSEMIERAAKAVEPMCKAFGRGDMPMQVAREFARVVIEAIRKPTEAMINSDDLPYSPGEMIGFWETMIDAALAPPVEQAKTEVEG